MNLFKKIFARFRSATETNAPGTKSGQKPVVTEPTPEQFVNNSVCSETSKADRAQVQRALVERYNKAPQVKSSIVREKLTDAVVERLVGHTNVVYYNCETNAWNTNQYNAYPISFQDIDTASVKEFKSVMGTNPEFSSQYEFVASITMTIDRISFPDWGKTISNPKYDQKGTAVVGNIIVKNKATGKYELYCKSWIGVRGYFDPDGAVRNGASWFAFNGARYPDFRAALIAAHTRRFCYL